MGRIILFEKDGYINNELTQMIQDRFSQVTIKLVFSRDECLAELQAFPPDILMLGANIFDSNGLSLIDQVRKMHSGITIILVTDYDIDEYRKDAILRGANHIISKELWTGSEILALINTILSTRTGQIAIDAEKNGLKHKQPPGSKRRDSDE